MDPQGFTIVAQEAWRLLEPYHAEVYFAPEHRQGCDEAGLRGGWMAYFASRAAPLGRASAELVTALFYNFEPEMVRRAIPAAWGYAAPEKVLQVRYSAIDIALRRVFGSALGSAVIDRASRYTRQAAESIDVAGRPLCAANAALDWPDAPHLTLWHATTVLREHRGDGHIAALVTEGIGGCQAHVMQVAAGRNSRSDLQRYRSWSDDDWENAATELRSRGWIRGDGRFTERGHAVHRHVSGTTDRLAAAPYATLGDRAQDLLSYLRPIAQHVVALGDVPYPNPMGVPVPSRPAGEPSESRETLLHIVE